MATIRGSSGPLQVVLNSIVFSRYSHSHGLPFLLMSSVVLLPPSFFRRPSSSFCLLSTVFRLPSSTFSYRRVSLRRRGEWPFPRSLPRLPPRSLLPRSPQKQLRRCECRQEWRPWQIRSHASALHAGGGREQHLGGQPDHHRFRRGVCARVHWRLVPQLRERVGEVGSLGLRLCRVRLCLWSVWGETVVGLMVECVFLTFHVNVLWLYEAGVGVL